ncbi:hypothetical protein M5689_009648 [Euphorbia peplus]|nr:hypothetical protein M5689_009648 [Euphorbia peplus]
MVTEVGVSGGVDATIALETEPVATKKVIMEENGPLMMTPRRRYSNRGRGAGRPPQQRAAQMQIGELVILPSCSMNWESFEWQNPFNVGTHDMPSGPEGLFRYRGRIGVLDEVEGTQLAAFNNANRNRVDFISKNTFASLEEPMAVVMVL